MRPLIAAVVRSGLRAAFRRIVWVGPPPTTSRETPLVLYANHHNYFDGYLAWMATEAMSRPLVTWMEEWDRYPLFAPLGALPFPAGDPARRAATMRTTARRLHNRPATALAFFPEGVLHRADDGILPFSSAELSRIHRLLSVRSVQEPEWAPLAIRVFWEGHSRPTAYLTSGAAVPGIQGDEESRLAALWGSLHETTRGATGSDHSLNSTNSAQRTAPGHSSPVRVLLDGRGGADEGMSMGWTAPFFKRYIR